LVAGFPPNPHVSLLLARRAARTRTPWTESALREAVAEDRVLAVVPGKRGRVTDAALSPDGTKLFVKTQDAVDVYDTKTVRLLQTTAGSDRVVVATQLTGPHPVALTKGKDGLVMWHLGQSPAPQRSLPQTHPSHSVFSRDGRTL